MQTDDLARARLAAIVGSSDDAIIGKDLNGIITDWNRAAERLFGYTAREAIGSHISLIAPEGREAEMADILAHVTRGEMVDHFEAKRRRKDGGIVDVSLTVSPIHDSTGRVVGASKIARDITEHKRLRRGEGLLAAIIASSDDAIISKNLNGIITSWNSAAEKLYGYTAEEALGQHIKLIAPPGGEAEMHSIIERIRKGERVEHFDTKRQRKDGTLLDISLTVSPIYDGANRIVGASKIARDITERHLADQRLQLLIRELDHRAKNVLAIAQAMLRLTRADTVRDFVNAVEGRILALARVHGQVAENRWDGAELQALVAAEADVFSQGDGRLCAEGPKVWVSPAAAQVIGVILHELATNAAKHGALSAEGGSIQIGWQLDPEGNLKLSWRERGGPDVSVPSRRGFGTQVIEQSVSDQLGGHAAIRWAPSGLHAEFTIPSEQVVRRPSSQRALAG